MAMTDDDVIRTALRVAAETRTVDLMLELGFTSMNANNFRDRCRELHDQMMTEGGISA